MSDLRRRKDPSGARRSWLVLRDGEVIGRIFGVGEQFHALHWITWVCFDRDGNRLNEHRVSPMRKAMELVGEAVP